MPSTLAPEALLPRSDSKNPATTCKGMTSSGRPCRRPLAASPKSSPTSSPGGKGVIAVLHDVNDQHDDAAVYFCWQHKDQAQSLATSDRAHLHTVQERSSIDSLADRLGVLNVEDGRGKKNKRTQGNGHLVRKDTLPQAWQNVPGPLIAVSEDHFNSKPAPKPQRRRTRGDVHFSFFCCARSSEVDDSPPSRPRPAMAQTQTHVSTRPQSARPTSQQSPRPLPTHTPQRPQVTPVTQGSAQPQSNSQTQSLLSLIPPSLSPQTTSLLLTELSKPFTPSDHEPGYIYIFCLSPNVNTSRSLYTNADTPSNQSQAGLAVPRRTLTGRRTSDAISTFAVDSDAGMSAYDGNVRSTSNSPRRRSALPPPKKALMLKIGRAANVQRRMTQWANQCGHEIDLLRYYPYASQSNPPSPAGSPSSRRSRPRSLGPSSGPRPVPLVARVERLIHVELGEQRIKRSCEGCGREHREWFEVEATKMGVKNVDEVVRRWVAWGEREAAKT